MSDPTEQIDAELDEPPAEVPDAPDPDVLTLAPTPLDEDTSEPDMRPSAFDELDALTGFTRDEEL